MTQLAERETILANRKPQQKAIEQMGDKFGVNPDNLLDILGGTVIRGTRDHQPTRAEVLAFVVVANNYGLNPLTREIHAFCDGQRIVPIVGIDGWARIANNSPLYNGCDFKFEDKQDGKPHKVTCTIHIKGRDHPFSATEYFEECRRDSKPWTQMPRRMLRHKAFIQAARLAFSIAGIYDEDEAADILNSDNPARPTGVAGALALVNQGAIEGEVVEPDVPDSEVDMTLLDQQEGAPDAQPDFPPKVDPTFVPPAVPAMFKSPEAFRKSCLEAACLPDGDRPAWMTEEEFHGRFRSVKLQNKHDTPARQAEIIKAFAENRIDWTSGKVVSRGA